MQPKDRSAFALVAIALASALLVRLSADGLAERLHKLKIRDEVYVLPPPDKLRAATLGYRAAAVDLLWAKLLVVYGMHWQAKEPFVDLPQYLDGILALEPDYWPLYRYVDTLLVFRPPRGTEADARLARKYLERGIRERPYDHRVWLQYGQFVAYLGPSFLQTEKDKQAWRRVGAKAILRAVELGADADRALGAASILGRAGERNAAIAHLERAYAVADDDATREEIAAKLTRLHAGRLRDRAERAVRAIEESWQADLPFVSRGTYLLMGPKRDPVLCAGGRAGDPACATDWANVVGAKSSER